MRKAGLVLLLVAGLTGTVRAEVLTVGPGQRFAEPGAALLAARAGDTIEVVAKEPLVLERVALRVTVARLTIRGRGEVTLDGAGFVYSGVGAVPRAIVQVEPGAEGVTIEHLVLRGAHNAEGNGAGVRINGANGVTVRGCEITACDMGAMSNGGAGQGKEQRFEDCFVHANGSDALRGFSHNLYLGGEGVTLERCTVSDSRCGHNLKSRARTLVARSCSFVRSSNREADLVDSELTEEGADAVFEDCLFEKAEGMAGNRGVIHFGRDGGHDRRGVITLRGSRVVTGYVSAVVTLSGSGTACVIDGCDIENAAQREAALVAPAGAVVRVTSSRVSACYGGPSAAGAK